MDGGHTTDPLVELGVRLDRLRQHQGLTVAALADRSDLDRAAVDAVLKGETNAGISILLRLAGALDAEVGELLAGISWEPGEGGGAFRIESRPSG
jgi:transcriptional regulator with XRE-family HTH domain